MSYVVFARRYRPQNFDQIIGQEHISKTLKNAISENRVAHAYLFSGPRGVGKTTTARILAKALNCKEGPTPSPCGKCPNCQEITAGSSVDVMEIDGASNRGIDEIRSLRENVKFAPAASRYKIYIIDEAHQITDAAFNALLKTLEEPPSHVVFILATTEPQKIPITILSRCQRYRFRLLSSKEITGTLERIISTEKLKIEQAALQVVTNASGGSLRDALSLLDQAVSFISGEVTAKDVQELLGFLPAEIISSATEALSGRDAAKILEIVKDVNNQGYNLLQFVRDLREHLRNLLLFKLNPSVLEITEEEKSRLDKQQALFTPAWLVRSGHLLSKAHDEMRWSEQPRVILELFLLKLVQPYVDADELLERLERMPRDTTPPAAKSVAEAAGSYEAKEPAPSEPAAADPSLSAAWGEVIAEFQKQFPLRIHLLSGTTPVEIKGSSIFISANNKFQEQGINLNKLIIETIAEKKFGKRLGLNVIVNEPPEAQGGEMLVVEEENKVAPVEEVFKVEADIEENPGIPAGLDKILDKFPGRVSKKR
jgi:DNA polymerase III subunit gamma/tau